MLDFLYAKVNHTWSASDALLNKIDDYIAHDQVLKKYANPDPHHLDRCERDRTRSRATNVELNETGPFQDILGYLESLQRKDISYQFNSNSYQRTTIFDNANASHHDNSPRKIFFAMENWYTFDPDNLLIRRDGKIIKLRTQLHINGKYHYVTNLLESAVGKIQQKNAGTECAQQRCLNVQNAIIEEITSLKNCSLSDKDIYKQHLSGIEPIYMMTGEAELIKIPSEAKLRVRQLHLHFPGEYRYRSLWPWENIDLRPMLVTNPTDEMFNYCSEGTGEAPFDYSLGYRTKAWWSTFTTFHNDLFCNYDECKAQVQNQAIWYFFGMLLLGWIAMLITSAWTGMTIITMIADPIAVTASIVYLCYVVITTAILATHNHQSLKTIDTVHMEGSEEWRYRASSEELNKEVTIHLNPDLGYGSDPETGVLCTLTDLVTATISRSSP